MILYTHGEGLSVWASVNKKLASGLIASPTRKNGMQVKAVMKENHGEGGSPSFFLSNFFEIPLDFYGNPRYNTHVTRTRTKQGGNDMYEIQIYVVALNTFKTLARIYDRQAAFEYASTVYGSVVKKNGQILNY